MSTPTLVQTGTCRLCSQPISNEGHGWYHDGRNLGTVRGIWPHFAHPAVS